MAKNIKKKLVALLACAAVFCVGGAIAAGNPVTANAEIAWTANEVITEADGFYTHDGASIKATGSGYGIRWSATVTDDFYTALTAKYNSGEEISFGTLVGPASQTLTVGDGVAKNKVWSTQPTFENGEEEFTFNAQLEYSTVAEANQTAAFALELQARMYVAVTPTEGETIYYYAEQGDVARSMRDVAIAALYNDYNTYQAAIKYVGSEWGDVDQDRSMDNDFVQVVDDVKGSVTVEDLTAGTEYQAYIGAKKVADSVTVDEDGVATVSVTKMPNKINQAEVTVGEEYELLLIDAENNVIVQPFKAVTRYITTAEELSNTFQITDYANSAPTTIFDGYYVLGKNIDWNSADWHKVDQTGTDALNALGPDTILGKTGSFGLTGTFDGNGYKIDGMQVTSGGLFGFIEGGTVKNTAFTNVVLKGENSGSNAQFGKSQAALAFGMYDARIENVYIQADTIGLLNDANGDTGNRALVANAIAGKTDIVDCIFYLNSVASSNQKIGSYWYGALCGLDYRSRTDSSWTETWDGASKYTRENWQNVYIIAPTEMYQTTFLAYNADAAVYNIRGYNGTDFYALEGEKVFHNTAVSEVEDKAFGNWSVANGVISWNGTPIWFEKDEIDVEKTLRYSQADNSIVGYDWSENEVIESVTFADSTAATVENGAVTIEGTMDGSVKSDVVIETNKAIYTASVQMATKVITTAAELSNTFQITAATMSGTTISDATKFDGYYVLGDNIKWEEDDGIHKVDENSLLSTFTFDNTVFMKNTKPIGLTGTFDGNGYTVDGMQVSNGGLFGFIAGGTVKNVAFINVGINGENLGTEWGFGRSKAALAFYMGSGTIDNVYIHATNISMLTSTISGHRALVTNGIGGESVIKNSIFKLDAMENVGTWGAGGTVGALFGNDYRSRADRQTYGWDGGTQYTRSDWQGIYVIAPADTHGTKVYVWSSSGYVLNEYAISGYDASANEGAGGYVALDETQLKYCTTVEEANGATYGNWSVANGVITWNGSQE